MYAYETRSHDTLVTPASPAAELFVCYIKAPGYDATCTHDQMLFFNLF